jgi:HD-GYP domain-containing protein (c-di-GMP phosphodiesterase class II)
LRTNFDGVLTSLSRCSIPNIPFFYLCFRAYSHYRALYGSRLLDHLVTKKLITSSPSSKLDEAYAAGILKPAKEAAKATTTGSVSSAEIEKAVAEVESRPEGEESMLLQNWNGRVLAEAYELPEMEIEIERAVEQVEKAIKTAKEKAGTAQPESKSEEAKR